MTYRDEKLNKNKTKGFEYSHSHRRSNIETGIPNFLFYTGLGLLIAWLIAG